jgi:hypothetical protein
VAKLNLVVGVPGYRPRGPWFDSRLNHILLEVVDVERIPLSLMRINEKLLEKRINGSGLETED